MDSNEKMFLFWIAKRVKILHSSEASESVTASGTWFMYMALYTNSMSNWMVRVASGSINSLLNVLVLIWIANFSNKLTYWPFECFLESEPTCGEAILPLDKARFIKLERKRNGRVSLLQTQSQPFCTENRSLKITQQAGICKSNPSVTTNLTSNGKKI